MKCQAGKCGGAMKEKVKGMKCQDGKCGADKMKEKAKEEGKKAVTKGKCGQGKCG
jgi:uncharacterized low-complexity protein